MAKWHYDDIIRFEVRTTDAAQAVAFASRWGAVMTGYDK